MDHCIRCSIFSRIRSTKLVPPPRNFAFLTVETRLSASCAVLARE
jgi:hypothetical protein